MRKIFSNDTLKDIFYLILIFSPLVLLIAYGTGLLDDTVFKPMVYIAGLSFRDTLLALMSIHTWTEWFCIEFNLLAVFLIIFAILMLCHIFIDKDIMLTVTLVLAGLFFLTVIIAIIKRIFD